jgi:hypothetical protein
MQATSVITIPAAVNGVEPAADPVSAGQSIRISSAQGTKSRESLFTAILQQGITLGAGSPILSGNPGDASLGMMVQDGTEEKDGSSPDVCGLLMQLMLMNASPAMNGSSVGNTIGNDVKDGQNGPGVITGFSVADAAAAIGLTMTDGTVADMTTAAGMTAESRIVSANGQGSGAAFGTLIDPEGAAQTPSGKANVASAVPAGLTSALEQSMRQESVQEPAATDAAMDASTKTGILPNMAESAGVVGKHAPTDGKTSDRSDTGMAPATIDTTDGQDIQRLTASGRKDGDGVGADAGERKRTETGEAPGTVGQQVQFGASFGTDTIDELTSADRSAAVEKALNRFAEDLRSLRGGAHELKIVLEPESLGVLTISVTKTETGISAKIKSEDKAVAAAISDHLQKLISTIESKGIRVDDVDVAYSQTDQSTGFGQRDFSRGGEESQNSRYMPSFAKNQETDASVDFWQEYAGGVRSGDTTVDYRV